MRLEVFTALKIDIAVLSVTPPFSLVGRFLVPGEYTVSIFCVEDRGGIFYRNVGTHSPGYTVT
jgi:hypothetical protein